MKSRYLDCWSSHPTPGMWLMGGLGLLPHFLRTLLIESYRQLVEPQL